MKKDMNARETRIQRKTRQRRRKIRNLPMMADVGNEYLPSPPEIIEIPNSEFYEETQDLLGEEDEEGEKEGEKKASVSDLDLQAVSSMPPLTDPMPPVKEGAWYRFTHWIGERMERFFLL